MTEQPKVTRRIRNVIIAATMGLLSLDVGKVKAQDAARPPLTAPQLEQLVAPIALYPDPLLAEVLMASTYPLDIVQAERWLQNNKKPKDDQVKAEADKQSWDASVKSLIATPDVLEMMSTKVDWTRKLGDAVVAQQPDVMDAIQRLRAKAQANNKLTSTKEQTVTVQQVENKKVITIEPTQPDTVYVPYYDPAVVYGDWPYSDYPPYYFPTPGYIGAGIVATGIAFGGGYALGRWVSGGRYWGGGFNWRNNNINIDRPINGGGTNWRRHVEHRQGVANRGGRQQGLNFRGSRGQQVINPGGLGNQNRGGNRVDAGNRVSAGNRGNRHTASTRPSGGARNARYKGSGAGQRHARAANVNSRSRVGAGGHRGHATHARSGAQRHAGGGGMRGGGMRGGGRRSDIRLKHDIMLLGHLDNGLGFYRFVYNGGQRAYVGVMAQEVQLVAPEDVVRDRNGYLKVLYDRLGLRFQTYDQWIAEGAIIPATVRARRWSRSGALPLSNGRLAIGDDQNAPGRRCLWSPCEILATR